VHNLHCNHCPYVKAVEDRINRIAKIMPGIICTALYNSNDESFILKIHLRNEKSSKEKGFVFPYLRDDSQETARAYDAVCTPDIYLFDENRVSVQRQN
jgi:hypothetical protein